MNNASEFLRCQIMSLKISKLALSCRICCEVIGVFLCADSALSFTKLVNQIGYERQHKHIIHTSSFSWRSRKKSLQAQFQSLLYFVFEHQREIVLGNVRSGVNKNLSSLSNASPFNLLPYEIQTNTSILHLKIKFLSVLRLFRDPKNPLFRLSASAW